VRLKKSPGKKMASRGAKRLGARLVEGKTPTGSLVIPEGDDGSVDAHDGNVDEGVADSKTEKIKDLEEKVKQHANLRSSELTGLQGQLRQKDSL